MISYIRGEVIDHNESSVVIDVNGLGYEIFVPYRVLCSLERVTGQVELYTYLAVKEDQIALYGFSSKEELKAFKLLITVSGIGPKGALAILSNMTTEDLILAVLSDDAKSISKVPGIGAKTAGKLVIELKDRFSLQDTLHAPSALEIQGGGSKINEDQTGEGAQTALDEAVSALTALGYSSTEALKAVRAVDNAKNMTTEQILKNSLKYL